MPRLAILFALFCAVGSVAGADKYPNPPLAEEIIGGWQGYSDSQLEFARLELDLDGRTVVGACIARYPHPIYESMNT